MNEESWKPIEGYEGYYDISSRGNVYSVRSGKCLTAKKQNTGYLRVVLSVNGARQYFSVHRLVAQAFIPNPKNKPTVNHINEVKDDNCMENLEWATTKEQNNYGTRTKRAMLNTDWKARTVKMNYLEIAAKHDYENMNNSQKKPVLQFSADGSFIARFSSLAEASKKLNINVGHICSCLRGRRNTSGGYKWKYEECIDPVFSV